MINTNSGSVYPEKSLLYDQFSLSPKEELTSIGDCNYPIAQRTYNDLTRSGTLIVNKSVVYDETTLPLNPEMDEVQKTNYVFYKLEDQLGSTSAALNISYLLDQGVGNEVSRLVGDQKGIRLTTTDNALPSHSLGSKRHINVLQNDNEKFTLIHEDLFEKRSTEDPEDDCTFFKIKTIVSGTLDGLSHCGYGDDMKVEVAYTEERKTMQESLEDDYTGTWVGGLFNRESYIKA